MASVADTAILLPMSAARHLRQRPRTAIPRLRVDAEWFKQRIAASGRSLNETARVLRMHPTALCRALTGERHLRLEEAVDLAGVLGVSLEDLVVAMGIPLRRGLRVSRP